MAQSVLKQIWMDNHGMRFKIKDEIFLNVVGLWKEQE